MSTANRETQTLKRLNSSNEKGAECISFHYLQLASKRKWEIDEMAEDKKRDGVWSVGGRGHAPLQPDSSAYLAATLLASELGTLPLLPQTRRVKFV